jgi:hypothetical protein
MRPATWLTLLLLSGLWGEGLAAPIRFGVTGIQVHDPTTWAALDAKTRAQVLTQRMNLATKALGASIVRLGNAEPRWFDPELLGTAGTRDWAQADLAIAKLAAPGVDVVVTLVTPPSELAGYQTFAESLVERYDGDTSFGVADPAKNYEYPDIDGSGSIQISDWTAAQPAQLAWAEGHRLGWVEVGQDPDQLEAAGQLAEGAYGSWFQSLRTARTEAGAELQVLLGGTSLDDHFKNDFTARIASIGDPATPWFEIANAHVLAKSAELSQTEAATALGEFGPWLAATGQSQAARWVGELSFASGPATAAGGGPGTDPRTNQVTQAASLVKLTFLAIEKGYTAILYAWPLELEGSVAPHPDRASTGLLQLALAPGESGLGAAIVPRRAHGTWLELQAILADVEPAEVTLIADRPNNARGYAVGDKGWVLWYDWSLETDGTTPYGGQKKLFTIRTQAPWVRVRELIPSSVPAELPGSYQATYDFRDTLLEVTHGEAQLTLGEAPVWVVPDLTGPSPEPGAEQPAAGPEPEPSGPPKAGCEAGPRRAAATLWVGLWGVGLWGVGLWVRRRLARRGGADQASPSFCTRSRS